MRASGAQVALLILLGATLLLSIFNRPWTIVSIESQNEEQISASSTISIDTAWSAFDQANAFVTVESGDQLATGPHLIQGVGRITQIDQSSRAGLAHFDLLPADGATDFVILIGPVVRGTALRDAIGLSFSDFPTQLDYARFASQANKKAIDSIPLLAAPQSLVGKQFHLSGAIGRNDKSPREIVPVRLELVQ